MSPNTLAGRLGALRARIAARQPVPDDLALRLSVADAWWLERLFVELEGQCRDVACPRPRPTVLVTTTAEETAA